MNKKRQIKDEHLSDGMKPTNEDNMMMTRLNIEITEQMEKIFHSIKEKKNKKENYTWIAITCL